jgi:peptide/nickel transport system substrate-binding protein
MNGPRVGRRAFLAALSLSPFARALGRRPYGGALRLELPLAIGDIDPHVTDDAASALFSSAVADTLFAWDAWGKPYPALAASMPDADGDGARVALRPGLVTAGGAPLDARDVLWSLERSRRLGGRPLLGGFGPPRRVRGDALAVFVPGATPDALADALASPVTAVVPRSFRPEGPDGTGAFRATSSPGGLLLERNDRAARGPSYLDRIEIRRATDLAGALRAFESGDADVGFLGAGLHRRRPDAVDFRTEPFLWVVLRTGPEAGSWGAPGVAERLVESMDPARFVHLGLAPAASRRGTALWGGAPADLLVDEAATYLVEIARVVAAVLSEPGHELTPRPIPGGELERRRDEGRYALAIDVVRRIGPTPRHGLLALLAAANPELADKPPRGVALDPAAVARTLSLAPIGELSISGARAPDVHGLEAWDLGAVYRAP